MNKRISAKERGLLKGAIRRVFSRSELRRNAIAATRIEHFDPKRPRVTKWCRCPICKVPTAEYQMEVDHLEPIIPVDTTLELMTWDTVVDRTWCPQINLMAKCKPCHNEKSAVERKQRAKARKERKK